MRVRSAASSEKNFAEQDKRGETRECDDLVNDWPTLELLHNEAHQESPSETYFTNSVLRAVTRPSVKTMFKNCGGKPLKT